jgi:NADPH:quinone reductase-like Zn-dependent oxidoreductase
MKAIIYKKYGTPDVLHPAQVEKPTPQDDEVLIKVHATTATKGDCELRSFDFPMFIWLPLRLYMGVVRPRKGILGQDLAGVVEAVGQNVKRLKEGDHVFAATGMSMGAYAEYTCLPEKPEGGVIGIKPLNMTFEEAATVPTGGLVVLEFLRRANIQPGQTVLVNGAGGTFGTFAVQLAKYFGAEVTGVDSAGKLDMLCSLGADHVMDYTREDFTQNGKTYDVIFDVVGAGSFAIKSLNENGFYLVANPKLSHFVRAWWASMTSSKKVIIGVGSEKLEDLDFLKTLIEEGKLKAVIDRCYPLEQATEAHHYVESGQKLGNVVLTVGN